MVYNLRLYFLAIFSIIFLFLLSSCNNDEVTNTGNGEGNMTEEPDTTNGEWTMVFEEQFETDLSQWDVWYGGAFNEEIQLYRPEQLSLIDGILNIDIQRQDISGPTNIFDSSVKNFEYVSGRIESKETYGPSNDLGNHEIQFEASIKLPSGAGMWPAFWSYGDPWPTQGEIDILEARGSTPEMFQSNLFYGPTANININQGNEQEFHPGPDLTAGFHTYSMIWTEDTIEILFDGESMYTYESNTHNNINEMFGKDQSVILNAAVGGLFFTDRNSANYADSANMQIDWVRVYSR